MADNIFQRYSKYTKWISRAALVSSVFFASRSHVLMQSLNSITHKVSDVLNFLGSDKPWLNPWQNQSYAKRAYDYITSWLFTNRCKHNDLYCYYLERADLSTLPTASWAFDLFETPATATLVAGSFAAATLTVPALLLLKQYNKNAVAIRSLDHLEAYFTERFGDQGKALFSEYAQIQQAKIDTTVASVKAALTSDNGILTALSEKLLRTKLIEDNMSAFEKDKESILTSFAQKRSAQDAMTQNGTLNRHPSVAIKPEMVTPLAAQYGRFSKKSRYPS